MTIRLLVADDQELIRSALAALLDLEEDFSVVASVGRGDEIVAAAKATSPDVALLDIEMPGIDGLAAAGVLAQELPQCRSLILTTFGRPGYLRRAMESGAFADHGLSMLAWEAAQRAPCTTIQLNAHFLAAVEPGEFVELRGEVTRATKGLVFVRGIITAGDRDVAAVDGIWRVLRAT